MMLISIFCIHFSLKIVTATLLLIIILFSENSTRRYNREYLALTERSIHQATKDREKYFRKSSVAYYVMFK